jgi:NADPH:quinone reductase
MNIPQTCNAVVLNGPSDFSNGQITLPSLKKGEVLVKMAFTPVNPSDLAFLTGNYGLKKAFPVVPGLEGSGTVIASGGGFLANNVLNKRVACSAPAAGNGTWAEYMITDGNKCIALKPEVSLEQGSMFFVNPLTALSFSKQAKKTNADLVVLTAADSALAKMILFFMKNAGIPVLGIVRKPERTAPLETEGFKKVISSSDSDFQNNVKAFTKGYRNVMFFDALGGGSLSYSLLNALPDKAQMVIYGRLDLTEPGFSPQDILFKENIIRGYWLSKEAGRKSLIEILLDVRKVQKMLTSGFETKIQDTVGIADIAEGLDKYVKNMSAGKVLLKF